MEGKRPSEELASGKVKQARPSRRPDGPKYQLWYLKSSTPKRTNDEVHSTILMNPVLTALLDTPQMQRLRDIKQLGTAEHVYMNVNHNRFEHSMGVAHLAERMCQRIRMSQPSLRCTAKDVLCVQLAGLMHDIGHGPFSHAFENFVHSQMKMIHDDQDLATIYESDPQYQHWPKHAGPWTHEQASLMMVDAALAHLGLEIDTDYLDEPLKQIGDGIAASSMQAFDASNDEPSILTSRDFVFIKECILGKPVQQYESILGKKGFHGRTEEYQEWLYDIVANRHSGLDVDKVDYFARDQRRALRESGEIDKVMVEEVVVSWAECTDAENCCRCCTTKPGKHLMLVYPTKLVGPAMLFFQKRFSLHSRIYRHKTNDSTNYMIKEILSKADPYFRILSDSFGIGPSGQSKTGYDSLPPSRAMLDPRSYLRLRDCVVNQIESSTCHELAEARALVRRIWRRDLYKCVCDKILQCDEINSHRRVWEMSTKDIADEICALRGSHDDAADSRITPEVIIVDKCQVHHGLKDKDPVSRMRFLRKSAMNMLSTPDYRNLPDASLVDQSEYESFLPVKLIQYKIRIYSRDSSEEICSLLQHQFEQWWTIVRDQLEMTESSMAQNDYTNVLTQDSDGEDNFLMTPRRMEGPVQPMSITPTNLRTDTCFDG